MFRIDIPALLPTFNEVLRMHRFARTSAKNVIFGQVRAALIEAKVPKPLTYPLAVTVAQWCGRKAGRLRDADSGSYALKEFLDALVKFGFLPDDSPEYVRYVHMQAPRKGIADRTVFIIQ